MIRLVAFVCRNRCVFPRSSGVPSASVNPARATSACERLSEVPTQQLLSRQEKPDPFLPGADLYVGDLQLLVSRLEIPHEQGDVVVVENAAEGGEPGADLREPVREAPAIGAGDVALAAGFHGAPLSSCPVCRSTSVSEPPATIRARSRRPRGGEDGVPTTRRAPLRRPSAHPRAHLDEVVDQRRSAWLRDIEMTRGPSDRCSWTSSWCRPPTRPAVSSASPRSSPTSRSIGSSRRSCATPTGSWRRRTRNCRERQRGAGDDERRAPVPQRGPTRPADEVDRLNRFMGRCWAA